MPLSDGGMGFVGGFVNTGQALADIANTRSMIESRNIENQVRAFALQQSMASRNAMMEAAAENYGMAKPLTPDEMATREGTDQPITSGGASPFGQGDQTGGLTVGPFAGGPKPSDLHMMRYQQQVALAKSLQKNGAPVDQVLEAQKNADSALTQATTAKTQERKEQIDAFASLRNILPGAIDEKSLNDVVIPQAIAQWGQSGVRNFLRASNLQIGPNGRVAWNADTQAAIKAIGETALTQEQRLKEEETAQLRQIQRQRADEQIAHNQEVEAHQRSMEIIARDIANTRSNQVKAEAEAKAQKRGDDAEKFYNNQLNKDKLYSAFPQYKIADDQAQNIIQKLDSGQIKQLDAPTANQLGAAFKNMEEGFRNRVGGKYTQQEQANFNGMFQKVNKWLDSIGSGTPAFDTTTVRDMTAAMRNLSSMVNREVVMSSLDAMQKVSLKGGNPDAIMFRGDLQRLVNEEKKNGTPVQQSSSNGWTYVTIRGQTFKFKEPEEPK